MLGRMPILAAAQTSRRAATVVRDPLGVRASRHPYYGVGQASSFGALAAATEGRVHFAGEHTSIENEGFLDGAVESGDRDARRLLDRLGLNYLMACPDAVIASQLPPNALSPT